MAAKGFISPPTPAAQALAVVTRVQEEPATVKPMTVATTAAKAGIS